jgi:hypothetical protein
MRIRRLSKRALRHLQNKFPQRQTDRGSSMAEHAFYALENGAARLAKNICVAPIGDRRKNWMAPGLIRSAACRAIR